MYIVYLESIEVIFCSEIVDFTEIPKYFTLEILLSVFVNINFGFSVVR